MMPLEEFVSFYFKIVRIRDNSVGIKTGYGLDGKIFLFSTASGLTLGLTKPPIQWVPVALTLGLKRLGREAYHSPSCAAEVKKV
jgi:hypothetical protein